MGSESGPIGETRPVEMTGQTCSVGPSWTGQQILRGRQGSLRGLRAGSMGGEVEGRSRGFGASGLVGGVRA